MNMKRFVRELAVGLLQIGMFFGVLMAFVFTIEAINVAISSPGEVATGETIVEKFFFSALLGVGVVAGGCWLGIKVYKFFCPAPSARLFYNLAVGIVAVLLVLLPLAVGNRLEDRKQFVYYFLTSPGQPDARQKVVLVLWTFSYDWRSTRLANDPESISAARKWYRHYSKAAVVATRFGYEYPDRPGKFPDWGVPPLIPASRRN